jgi:RNA-directed DNA polymerase
MIIEPIFEADFQESSYGFRPQRSVQDAVGKISGGKINRLGTPQGE